MGAVTNGILDAGNMIVAQPYFISGKTGTLAGLAAGQCVASLQQLGMVIPISSELAPSPIRVSAVRLFYTPVSTPAGNGVGFEVRKTTVTAQHSAGGGTTKTPTRRKTSGYPAIVASETNMFVAAAAAITGGTLVDQGDAFGMVTAGDLSGGKLILTPADMQPTTIEAGEGLGVFVTQFSGTGILLVAFDFVR
jgi:hypothetical protein